jgi:hypothetical protein
MFQLRLAKVKYAHGEGVNFWFETSIKKINTSQYSGFVQKLVDT